MGAKMRSTYRIRVGLGPNELNINGNYCQQITATASARETNNWTRIEFCSLDPMGARTCRLHVQLCVYELGLWSSHFVETKLRIRWPQLKMHSALTKALCWRRHMQLFGDGFPLTPIFPPFAAQKLPMWGYSGLTAVEFGCICTAVIINRN